MWSTISYDKDYEQLFRGKVKMVKYAPVGNFTNSVQSGETVRFAISDQNALLDPLSTYIQTTISFNNNTNLDNDTVYSNKILQLDHSAHSLFTQLVLTHGNKEIERIQDYDVMNCFLNDMNWGSGDRGMRDYEGAGTVFCPGVPSALLTSYQVPSANTGTLSTTKNWMPWQGTLNSYTDTSSRVFTFGAVISGAVPIPTTSQNNYSTTHPQINNRLAFNPIGINDAAVTFSSGVNWTEFYNDFSNPTLTSNPALVGSQQYFTPDFCKTGFETFFSKTVLQRYMYNGFVKTDFITEATFFTKIRSGLVGELMPAERLRLIPLWLFPQLMLELTMGAHAFFTSWRSAGQIARGYTVTGMYLHCTLIEPAAEVRDYINKQYMNGGIKIASQTFCLGPKTTIVGGAIPATIPINQNFESLRDFIFMFSPNDFTIASHCRKHQRFSMGLTSYQLRIGNDYYPQLPITGNAGSNHGAINNWEMLQYTYTCFGKHCGPSSCSINAQNFAISCTAIDPTITTGGMNDNTQASLFESNRVRGTALFGIPCDKLNLNQGTLGGINTFSQIPFQLDLQYSAVRSFQRSVTCTIFLHVDFVCVSSPGPGGAPVVEAAK